MSTIDDLGAPPSAIAIYLTSPKERARRMRLRASRLHLRAGMRMNAWRRENMLERVRQLDAEAELLDPLATRMDAISWPQTDNHTNSRSAIIAQAAASPGQAMCSFAEGAKTEVSK